MNFSPVPALLDPVETSGGDDSGGKGEMDLERGDAIEIWDVRKG